MRRGILIPLVSLVVGLGLGLLVLWGKGYLLRELVGALQDELAIACPECTLEYDTLDLSLTRLKAVATNIRVTKEGEQFLSFKRIEGDFDLSEVFDRTVLLTELRLLDGRSRGVDPDSVTYRFIDQLSAPPPPERASIPRWKVKLLTLTVDRSEFTEALGTSTISGHGVRLKMARNERDNFELSPTIQDLRLQLPRGGREASLGVVDGLLEITEERVVLKRIRLTRRDARFEAAGDVLQTPGGPLSGEAHFSLDDQSVAVNDYGSLVLFGVGALSGKIGRPEITASFSNPSAQAPAWRAWVPTPVEFASLAGNFSLRWEDKTPRFSLTNLTGTGPDSRLLRLSTPVLIDPDGMRGGFHVELEEFNINGISLRNVTADFALEFPWTIPRWNIELSAGTVTSAGVDLGRLVASGSLEEERLTFVSKTFPHDNSAPFTTELRGTLLVGERPEFLPSQLTVRPQLGSSSLPALSVDAQVLGPMTMAEVSVQGTLRLESGSRTMVGPVTLNEGVLSLGGATVEEDVNLAARIALAASSPSSLSLSAKGTNPLSFIRPFMREEERCTDLSGTFDYLFDRLSPFSGNGTLNVSALGFGCGTYRVDLRSPLSAKIVDGSLSIRSLELGNQNSSLVTNGTMSVRDGLGLTLRGVLDTPSLAPLLGRVDDLRGNVAVNASLTGPLSTPRFGGQVSIENGSLVLETAGISLDQVRGVFTIERSGLEFDDLVGRINQGTFSVSGRIEPLSIERSVATFSFDGVLLEPLPDTTAVVSGSIGIGPDRSGTSALSGVVRIDGAEFRKTVSWGDIIRSTIQSVLRPQTTLAGLPSRTALPELPLDLHVTAPGSLVVDTTWGAGELRADLRLQGTIKDPVTDGAVEVLSGWVGLRDRRFEITSGRIVFKPGTPEPTVELLAETTMRSRQGDVVLVLLEASGALSTPKLSLSSDRGFSEQEILSLFTARGDLASSPRVAGFAGGLELDVLEALEDRTFLGLGRLVRDLARIDSISIEPSFSVQRGTVEPALVAKKQLFDHLALIAETPLGATQSDGRLRLVYDASPALELAGGLETLDRENGTALSVDLSYTLLGERRRFLDVRMSGNRMFRSLDILAAVRVSENSRLTERDLPRLSEQIVAFYRAQGFFNTRVRMFCAPIEGFVDNFCHQLRVQITEGRPTYTKSITIEGDRLPDAVGLSAFESPYRDAPASEGTRREFEQRLLNALRSEGYLGARVSSRFVPIEPSFAEQERKLATLAVEVTIGDPVTFTFKGNTIFSPADFLSTINLFGRRQPFGNNTITILVENIERKYNEAGYLFAAVKVSKTRDRETNRTVYDLEIDEGPQVTVSEVTLEGVPDSVVSALQSDLYEREPRSAALIFAPRYAVPDVLEVNSQTLQRALATQGYPDATVAVATEVDQTRLQVLIRYQISAGERVRSSSLRIEGAPPLDPPVAIPSGPLTIPEVNRFVTGFTQTLIARGYRSAAVSVAVFADDEIVLSVTPGPQSVLRSVSIEGFSACDEAVIRAALLVQENSPWDDDKIQESRRRLLRLGLFSRVSTEVTPLTDDAPHGRLVVEVHERSLRTLTVGAGANSELGLHLFGEATDRSWFGDGRSITARLDTYYDRAATEISQGVASLSFSNPALFGTSLGFVSDVRFQRFQLATQEFDLDRVAWTNYLYRSWASGMSASLGHTILSEDLSNVTPGAIVGDFDSGEVRLGFISSVLTLDRRDDPLLPSRGYQLGVEGQYAQELFGSEANYTSLLTRGSFIAPLSFVSPRWSFASGTRVGVAWTGPDTNAVPISQRFYLGGRSTVRGYRENSLGPLGPDGAVQGGDLLFIQNLELRYRLADSTQLVQFLDIGGLYFQGQPISAGDLRQGVGLGLRYLSPIGPIGFDVGLPIDRRDGESAVRFHFNIGTSY